MIGSALDPPITDQAGDIDRIWDLFLYLGLAVVVFVVAIILYVIIRYRRRDDQLPRQKHYNIPIEITYTVVPLLVVLVLFAITVVSINAVEDSDGDPDLIVDVTAFQWQWSFEYPDAGVAVIGGPGDETPELVLPANSTVQFDLRSLDVVHSFWVTAFRFKRDIIPGSPSSFTVDVGDRVGNYVNAGVCAEYCGLDHAFMRFGVRVLAPSDFDAWLAEQAAAAGLVEPASGSTAAGDDTEGDT
ncbi:MAG: cytochrome c oxidase subunit II [Acidimicrobiia bacterium]|nr:cytochrome c oxidase subunit II [Acidimicrobiia bacterium]